MTYKNTVVLAGGLELTAKANARAFECVGNRVINARDLDYALAASKLFELRALVLDTEHMEMCHIEKKIRRQGGRTGGPPPFTDDDRERLKESLERVVMKALNATGKTLNAKFEVKDWAEE